MSLWERIKRFFGWRPLPQLVMPSSNPQLLPGGLRVASTDELKPSTLDAYDRGVMTNDQMAELLTKCGWNVQVESDGQIRCPPTRK